MLHDQNVGDEVRAFLEALSLSEEECDQMELAARCQGAAIDSEREQQ